MAKAKKVFIVNSVTKFGETNDFNVLDLDNDRLTLSIYFGAKLAFTNLIVEDLNLSSAVCDDQDFNNSTPCSWSWNISGVADGNYYLNFRISDSIDVPTDSSDNNLMIDNEAPSMSNLNPLNATTGSESTPTFSITIGDATSKPSHCIAKRYAGGALSSTVNVSVSGSSCSTTVSLSDGQEGYVSWAGVDNAGNTSSYFSTGAYTYTTGGGGTGGNGGGGGGGGGEAPLVPPHSVDENSFCAADQDCKIDLGCIINKCTKLFGTAYANDLANLVVYPLDISPPAFASLLPSSRITLDPIYVTNKGNTDMVINANFECSNDQFCAKDFCVIVSGLSDPKLGAGGFKTISVECEIPSNVNIGDTYYTQLVFQTGSGVRKSVFITIKIQASQAGELVEASQDAFSKFFEYGLICFSQSKTDCLFKIEGAQGLGSFDSLNVAFAIFLGSVFLAFGFKKKPIYVLAGVMMLVWIATLIW